MRIRTRLLVLLLLATGWAVHAQVPEGSYPGSLNIPNGPGELGAMLQVQENDNAIKLDLGGQELVFAVNAVSFDGSVLKFVFVTDEGLEIPCELASVDGGMYGGTCNVAGDEGTISLQMGESMAGKQISDTEAINNTLESYMKGHETGDGAYFEDAFYRTAKLFWISDGELNERRSSEYIAGARGEPAPDEAQRTRRIEYVDITGTAAMAKVVLDYPNVVFTDYFTLLKENGRWKIVNKTFNADYKNQ